MALFILKRALAIVPVLLFLTLLIFVLNHLSPIDPARAALGPNATEEALEELRHELWLDRSLPEQYVHYLDRLLHGDFGYSARLQRPISDDLAYAVPGTGELALVAMIIALVIALILGLSSAGKRRGSGVFRLIVVGGSSAPAFLLAIGGILLFYSKLGWLPATGRTSYDDAPTGPTKLLLVDSAFAGRPDVWWDALQHIVLPAFCVALIPAVAIGRVLRSSLVSATGSDYARTARSKGLDEPAILRRHGLRNAAGPTLAMMGLQTGLMFAGVVVVETVFAWPGMGLFVAQAIPVGDFPAIAAVTLIVGFAYVVINGVVDVLQAVADPRIRL
jgi:peptide/nickel transport system permease protein